MGETAHHVLSCPEKGSVPEVIEQIVGYGTQVSQEPHDSI